MTDPANFDDHAIIRQVIELYDHLRHDPIGSRLASIEFASIGLWSAFQYELADLLYDHVWSETTPGHSRETETSGSLPRATLIFRPHPVQSTLLLRMVTGGEIARCSLAPVRLTRFKRIRWHSDASWNHLLQQKN